MKVIDDTIDELLWEMWYHVQVEARQMRVKELVGSYP